MTKTFLLKYAKQLQKERISMIIEANFIAGVMLGFELLNNPDDEEINHIVVDIFFVRIVFTY